MQNVKIFKKKNSFLIILFGIISNHYLFFFDIPILIKINLLLCLLFLIYYIFKFEKNNFLKIFFLLIIIISLGTPTIFWDGRITWLFKAKQIFFENTILYSINNYAPFSNPDYPNMAPAFSAAIAKLIGHWNEIFPKIGFTIMFIPALLIFSRYLKNNFLLLGLVFTIFVVGKYFFNGALDGLVSIYFVCSALLLKNINESNQAATDFLLLIFCFIIFSMLKKECLVLLICLVFSYFLFMRTAINLKIFYCLLVSLIPNISWHLFCLYNGIAINDDIGFDYEVFKSSIFNIEIYSMIFNQLILNEKLFSGLVIFLISCFISKNLTNLKYIMFTCFAYLSVLFLIYLSTPVGIEFHLSSSAMRVIKPLALLLFIFSLLNLSMSNFVKNDKS